MFGRDYFNLHLSGVLNDGIEVFNLEPQQDAVPIRSVIRIPDWSVVMFHLETVELKHELAVPNQSLVLRAAVITSAIQQTLIPETACCHVLYGDERLRSHKFLLYPSEVRIGVVGDRFSRCFGDWLQL